MFFALCTWVCDGVCLSVENESGRAAVPVWVEPDATAPSHTWNGSALEVEHAITYPSRLIYYLNEDSESTYHNLNTQAKTPSQQGQKALCAVHLAEASFQLESFGSRFILDLTLNTDLLASSYVEIHYEEGKPILSKGGEHCYYHGQVRGNDASLVALSTCNGLHGMFDDGLHLYLIEPLKQTHSILFPFQMPRNIFEEMKYIELMIVSDHNMQKMYFRRLLTETPLSLALSRSFFLWRKVFKEHLKTRVVLVAMEIWTEKDNIPISVMPLAMLRDFAKYRQQHIKQHADAVHLFSNVTFHYRRSSVAFFGGMCSVRRGVGVNEYGSTWTMALSLSQSLSQNLGIQWDPGSSKNKECGCVDSWAGCIMEDTGVQHPRKFSKCSILDYKEFLLKGGGSCLFNRPTKLFEQTECGNGYLEAGEECDCGARADCYKECCKKCSLSNGAHCSDGPCCNNTCLFYPRGYSCRYAVNDCDISETCTGDSGQCPPNLHKQDGYFCHLNQGRCYSGECKTRDSQCKYVWGPSKKSPHDKFCYEKLNTDGSAKGNCGEDGDKWIQCSKHDVFCGYLLCANIGQVPRLGVIKGEVTPTTFNHQGRIIECSGGHVLLDDGTDLGYVEDGTPCGPSMMCLDRKCLPIQSLNMSACPTGSKGHICSNHGVCNNEVTCTCDTTWAGTDCSIPDPHKEPAPVEEEGPRGPSASNLIIGSIAGAILVAAIVLGGTGWGFK
uniref:ADAM metallopeptidase domain 23a n=1 Tax=Electrophorus electricus TaxID=8005 RepID=A0A4W4FED0_ELEEL